MYKLIIKHTKNILIGKEHTKSHYLTLEHTKKTITGNKTH